MMKFFYIVSASLLWIGSLCQAQDADTKDNELLNVDFEKINSVQLNHLEIKANLYFMGGDYKNAAKQYLQIIKYNIDDALAYYRLACCYAKLNYPEYAANFLITAVNAGYGDFDKIQNEQCFDEIKSNKDFARAFTEVQKYGQRFGATVFIGAEIFIKTRVYLPKNYDPAKTYQLLVGLHGYGDNAENFGLICEYIQSDQYILVVPEAPYIMNNQVRLERKYSWDIGVRDEDLWQKSDPAVIDYIKNVVDYFNKEYIIENTFLLGFSQGTTYAYAAGIKNSDRIDGIIAFGGSFPKLKKYPWFLGKEDLEKGRKIKICIVHGNSDQLVEDIYGKKAKRLLSGYNYDVKFISFEGGHIVDTVSLNKAINWMQEGK